MAIKETTRKIHLLSYTPKKGKAKDISEPPRISLFVDKNKMQFSRYAIDQMHMRKKFVRFFYEPTRKIIAWQVAEKMEHAEMKEWRVCNTHPSGIWQVSVKGLLEQFQLGKATLKNAYRDLEVKKYREIGLMSKPNDTYFFVQLKEEYADEEDD